MDCNILLFGTVIFGLYIYSDPPSEDTTVISVRECDVCLPTPRLSPFYLSAYDG